MLPEFKKRIDTLRQILVGAVPSPQGQIDQITYALIYKFMSDRDDRASSLPGGKRTYFTGEYEKYSWHKLLDPSLGAHDRLVLYRDALSGLAKNPNLPELFQSIFQNAFLPFNEPRVLTLFLKEADKFQHSDSDDIGDAYEYLLQITGSQGDVGQFRTPRHIIKFIVEAVNPTKVDSVLDPAVGTAGFLIAAFNHVKHHHDGIDDITGLSDEKEERLTADELSKLNHNYRGFDIDPTMVRTAKVNMYLHGFKNPDIKNHDSLSSDDYWNDRYDVILANPPFMSPKGGIKPHGKFNISASRAEVLFVDYIASHLKPTGRAGIIVPEGVIFQSGKAYRELRKKLIEDSLYGVISLPAGVFQPYSGVKTSVLLLDKVQAKKHDQILFINISNDGYSLGTKRSEAVGNQIPEAITRIDDFKHGVSFTSNIAYTVSKAQILQSEGSNLSGDRYRTVIAEEDHRWPFVKLDAVFKEIRNGKNVEQISTPGKYRVSRIQTIATGKVNLNATKWTNDDVAEEDFLHEGDILFSHINSYDHLAKTAIFHGGEKVVHGINLLRLRPDTNLILPAYASFILKSEAFIASAKRFAQKAVNQASINTSSIKNLEIPLPTRSFQEAITKEITAYQNIVDASNVITKNYQHSAEVSPPYDTVKLSDVVTLIGGGTPLRSESKYWGGEIKWITSKYLTKDHKVSGYEYISKDGLENSSSNIAPQGSTIIITRVSVGKYAYADQDYAINQDLTALVTKDSSVLDEGYLYWISAKLAETIKNNAVGIGVTGVTRQFVADLTIPLPSIVRQKEIADELEAERGMIEASGRLAAHYAEKVAKKLSALWEM